MGMLHACLLLEHIGGSSGGELLSGQERAGREGSSSRSFKKRRSTDSLCRYYCHIYITLLSVNKDTCEKISSVLRLSGLSNNGQIRYYTSTTGESSRGKRERGTKTVAVKL